MEAGHRLELRPQHADFVQQLQGQGNAGEIEAKIALQTQGHLDAVQMGTGETPAMGLPAFRRNHPFANQFDDHFGMYGARAAEIAQTQADEFFENRCACLRQHSCVRHFQAPGTDRGLKDGIPSHVAPGTPGSIHEGGELGYSVAHAYGAAFYNRRLIVACVISDGEAETGPLAASWHSNRFLNPARDGAVLPILHLNGYKIANPTVLARIDQIELAERLRGYGYEPYFVTGKSRWSCTSMLATTLTTTLARIRRLQAAARGAATDTQISFPAAAHRTAAIAAHSDEQAQQALGKTHWPATDLTMAAGAATSLGTGLPLARGHGWNGGGAEATGAASSSRTLSKPLDRRVRLPWFSIICRAKRDCPASASLGTTGGVNRMNLLMT